MSGRQSLKLPFEQPIATYDIGLDSTATIFQILVKRLIKLSSLCSGPRIPLYIMTNSRNKQCIKQYFKTNNYFEYGSKNIFFFSQ